MFSKHNRHHTFHGILLIILFSFSAFYLAELDFIKSLSLSPLIVGIVIGMIYANSLRHHLPSTWVPGIQFCTKSVLRWAIILYGFRLTFQSVMDIGLAAIVIDALIVTGTMVIGLIAGKLLKMDRDMTILTSAGSAICGAAAVLGTEPVLKSKPYKTAIAVATVVIFGTIAMFIYPVLYKMGILDLSTTEMGIYTGSTMHEVAHAVGAGNSMSQEIASASIIVKMIRVIMLAPFLLILGLLVKPVPDENDAAGGETVKGKITIPWFAFGFLLVIGFNSLDLLPVQLVAALNYLDTFMLTMAMTALGVETSFDKFKKAGPKPFLLAFILFIWLMGGGYMLAKYLTPLFGH
ncbi:MAG: YeiH family protein [Bacteroidales bacterium]